MYLRVIDKVQVCTLELKQQNLQTKKNRKVIAIKEKWEG